MRYKILTVATLLVMCGSFVSAQSTDMFDVMKSSSFKLSNSGDIEVLYGGDSLEESILSKVTVMKPTDKNPVEDINKPNVKPSKPSDNGDGIVDKDKYFAGTKDFTNLANSIKDVSQNNWSAIRKEYDKFDDGGVDNVTIVATAYTSAAEENGGYEGMNAIGGKLGPGCIAAPKDIPFQTKIRISGLGVFNVEDRGSAIVRVDKETVRLDVWMDGYKEAMKFGKRVYKGRIM